MSARVPGQRALNARRALGRWAWRLFRREWRRQALVMALLTVAVAAAVCGVSVAYNMVSSPAATFGTAGSLVEIDGGDPRAVDSARRRFGTVDVIGRRFAPVPGSVEKVELRAQDPRGPYGAPMLRLRAGRFPAAAGDLAVTDEVARTFRVGIGDRLALDGRDRTVVGVVENPGDLGDDFALVAPAYAGRPAAAAVLVGGDPGRVWAAVRAEPPIPGTVQERHGSGKGAAAAGVLSAATVAMLLISLVAAAGFVVVAQRRLRQIGMLAAIGATEKHLRLVVLAGGAIVGVVAAVAGTVAGLAGWVAAAPYLEAVAGHRIGRFDIPWGTVVPVFLLAIVTAVAAAWWPARTIARIPVLLALSGRPPRPKRARRPALAAAALMPAGIGCLVAGIGLEEANPLLVIPGVLATALSVLLISPLAVRALPPLAGRAPVAVRLAVQDLARYQARSGAALAAIGLSLAIAVTVIVTARAAEHTAAEGNLSARQLMIWIGDGEPVLPDHTSADLDRLRTAVDRFAATLDRPDVVPLEVAISPAIRERRGQEVVRPFAALGRRVDANTYRDVGYLYVATPELSRHVGLDPAVAGRDADVLTAERGDLAMVNVTGPADRPPPRIGAIEGTGYSSAPRTFITPAGVRRAGLRAAPAGWLVESRAPFTAERRAAARDMAVAAGLTVEARDGQGELPKIRAWATAAGLLLALGILAMAVGLIRGETAGDLRILTAAGATGRTRRTITGATAGALALLGAALGAIGAYAALLASYSDDLSRLRQVPVLDLTVLVAGVPLLAAVTGWLLAGREPPGIARRPIE